VLLHKKQTVDFYQGVFCEGQRTKSQDATRLSLKVVGARMEKTNNQQHMDRKMKLSSSQRLAAGSSCGKAYAYVVQ
jgi:fructose-1,6-bisphosphatase/inositol monophosphatase family enzyme